MKNTKIVTVLLIVITLVSLLALGVSADETSGYVLAKGKVETNIKWRVVTEGDEIVAYFEIDKDATGKTQTTVVNGYDPVTGEIAAYNTPIKNGWGLNAKITKVVIGDGITKLGTSLFNRNNTLKTVEIPTSLVELDWCVFEHCNKLQTIYIKGNEPEVGTLDLSNITGLISYNFHATYTVNQIKKIVFNPDFKGEIPNYLFHNQNGITELEIPEGVTTIKNNAFKATSNIEKLTIRGKNTAFESNDVFSDCTGYPEIIGYTGSKAEEFAKANGYTFVDIETNKVVVTGTKPAPKKSSSGTSDTTSPSGSGTTPAADSPEFKHDGATAFGHSTGNYNGTPTVDTYWAYYASTKTLEFTSGTTGYNETGRISNCDDKIGWKYYKSEIEHIVIGQYINRISTMAFIDMPCLKDIKMPSTVTQFSVQCFKNCRNLTTIYVDGTERVEGTADFSNIKNFNDCIEGTAIQKVIFSSKVTTLNYTYPDTLKTIVSPVIDEAMIAFAKDNFYDLQDANDPSKVYKYSLVLDSSYYSCGGRCAASFDKASGTLTIHGIGNMSDIMNYHGGGSKTSPWFSFKSDIKHVVLTEKITGIGKYNFAYCPNLETVEIPDNAELTIGNAAFEGCNKLVSIYTAGSEPVKGTLDLHNIKVINAWTFAYNYLIANVVINSELSEIGSTAFEECVNVKNIYGTPGSFAETFAKTATYTFFDYSKSKPVAVECVAPETTDKAETTVSPETETSTVNDEETTVETFFEDDETEPTFVDMIDDQVEPVPENKSTVIIIVIVAVIVVAGAAVAAVLIIKGKKKKEKKPVVADKKK